MNGAVTVNAEQVVMVMLVGCGRGKAKINHELVADTIQSVATRIGFTEDERDHRRGLFGVKAIGISHGGGQKVRRRIKRTMSVS